MTIIPALIVFVPLIIVLSVAAWYVDKLKKEK